MLLFLFLLSLSQKYFQANYVGQNNKYGSFVVVAGALFIGWSHDNEIQIVLKTDDKPYRKTIHTTTYSIFMEHNSK